MKTKILSLMALSICLFSASCQKESIIDNQHYCPCEEPTPLSPDGSLPDISWTEYNSVHDACFYFERKVKFKDLIYRNLPNYVFAHLGDTLKVFGWLWNSELMDNRNTWIANDARYATGTEQYPPWTGVGGGYGYGIQLINLHVTDTTHIKNKCFLTGIIRFTSFYTETGESGGQCIHLRLKLNVIDCFFEEDEK